MNKQETEPPLKKVKILNNSKAHISDLRIIIIYLKYGNSQLAIEKMKIYSGKRKVFKCLNVEGNKIQGNCLEAWTTHD